jgi:hypothetical protein
MEDVFVRKLPTTALAGAAAVALAGAAVAANPNAHRMDVPLPDGSVAHVEYYGDVVPKVTVDPISAAALDREWTPLASVAGFDRMIAEMNRRTAEMIKQAQQMARQPIVGQATPYVAAYGGAPAGVTSTTIVSFSNGSSTCTRTTETMSQGPGKPPKVSSSVSGNCGPEASPTQRAPTAARVNRT